MFARIRRIFHNMTSERNKDFDKLTRGDIDAPIPGEFRPSEFMRARRPELFSDSKITGEPRLTREAFEYHLHTLTSRKQETEFEHFSRRLAERELCPNLLPQTGPTGGGDSKVDTETYPVADQIALRWYEGLPKDASQERWAFAFSAKEKWRSKVQSDVEKIADTGRDYKLIYFITNQFVRDKQRAEVEGALEKQHKVTVRILDRSWIVKSVFENGRLLLAIETLNITGYDEVVAKVAGPRDVEREAELKEIEAQISDSARYQGVAYQQAEDCLRAALLARALELPRVEVDGRFARAERIADKVDHPQQRLRIAYNKAWTAFWWYDDFEELNRLYDRVEELAIGSHQATDLELLVNLWTVLNTTVRRGQLDPTGAKLEVRTESLKAALEQLIADKRRANNSLMARTDKALMDLQLAASNESSLDGVLQDLREIINASEGLVAYPIEPIGKIVRELGDFLTDNDRYDELFETIVSITERRVSNGEAGRALVARGFQKLGKGKTYDAITLFGRAQQKLAMHEYRGELVSALVGCGLAYESAGLLWAARANVLAAANQAFSEYWEHGKIIPQALTCLRKLIWLELQLGRVPYVLQWKEVASAVAGQLVLKGDLREAFVNESTAQDRVLAILLLKTDVWELKWLDFLPEILDTLGLDYSWMALLYALGYEDHLRTEGVIPESENPEAVRSLFGRWIDQPASKDLSERPELLRESRLTFRSFVLGCEVIVQVTNNLSSIYLGENILGALEALLATSLDRSFPHASEFKINLEPSDFITGQPEYEFDDAAGEQTVKIRHSVDILKQVSEDQATFRSWVENFIVQAAFRFTFVDGIESYAKRLFGDEVGMGRAINFSDPAIPIGNILGDSPKFRLSEWEAEAKGKRFPLRRNEPWNQDFNQPKEAAEANPEQLSLGEGSPPPELLDINKLKHTDRRVLSLINIPVWNKAGWSGTLYIIFPELDHPPYMALGFKDAEAAQIIFRGWLDKLGRVDSGEQLRVSIITGIDRSHPASYKVIIGTNLSSADKDSQSKQFIMVSRINQMDPPDTKNLDGFLRRLERIHKYILLPAHFIDVHAKPTPFFELGILKQQLHVRPAWQIGENDPDVSAIREDDDPIIPDGIEDAPVLRALQRFSKQNGEKKRVQRESKATGEMLARFSAELDVHDLQAITTFIEYLSKSELKGHWTCYCGSGKKLRQCHLEKLLDTRSRVNVSEAKDILNQLRST